MKQRSAAAKHDARAPRVFNFDAHERKRRTGVSTRQTTLSHVSGIVEAGIQGSNVVGSLLSRRLSITAICIPAPSLVPQSLYAW